MRICYICFIVETKMVSAIHTGILLHFCLNLLTSKFLPSPTSSTPPPYFNHPSTPLGSVICMQFCFLSLSLNTFFVSQEFVTSMLKLSQFLRGLPGSELMQHRSQGLCKLVPIQCEWYCKAVQTK